MIIIVRVFLCVEVRSAGLVEIGGLGTGNKEKGLGLGLGFDDREKKEDLKLVLHDSPQIVEKKVAE